jgi:hypothetical protein
LSINDEFILILQIQARSINCWNNPKVRVERIEGIEPIPVGVGTIKVYSPVIFTKKVRVSVGYDERNVLLLNL